MSYYADKFQIDQDTILIKDSEAHTRIDSLADELDDQVEAINDTISSYHDHKYLFIGDSYLQGWTDDTSSIITNFGTIIKNRLGLVDNESYFHNELGGTGFGSTTNDKNYSVLLQDLAQNMTQTQKDSITDIVVLGCRNDAVSSVSATTISSGLTSFVTYAHSNFPHAKIHIGIIGWSRDSDIIESLNHKVMPTVLSTLKGYTGVYYVNGIENTLIDKTLIDTVGNHPNANGQQAIADNFLQYLQTGFVTIQKTAYATKTPVSGVTYGGNIQETLHNDDISVTFYNTYIAFSNAISLGNTYTKVCDLSDDFLFGNSTRCSFNIYCVILSEGNYTNREITFLIDQSAVYVKLTNALEHSYESLNVSQITPQTVSKVIGTFTQF